MEEYLAEKGIKRENTPVTHPQANPVERVNRTLKTMIMSYLKGNNHKGWDEKLLELVFALNTAIHSSTGLSPARLVFGRDPSPPNTGVNKTTGSKRTCRKKT